MKLYELHKHVFPSEILEKLGITIEEYKKIRTFPLKYQAIVRKRVNEVKALLNIQ